MMMIDDDDDVDELSCSPILSSFSPKNTHTAHTHIDTHIFVCAVLFVCVCLCVRCGVRCVLCDFLLLSIYFLHTPLTDALTTARICRCR